VSRERTALELIGLIYDAAVDSARWQAFAESLSSFLGGAAVSLAMRAQGHGPPLDISRVGLDVAYSPILIKHLGLGLPWIELIDFDEARERFVRVSDHFLAEDLEKSDFYVEFMKPQGLACEAPIIHMVSVDSGLLGSGVVIFRAEGGPEIGDSDLATLDLLVPHFARAVGLHAKLRRREHTQIALSEVIDRMPTGVILLNADRQPVLMNRLAHSLIEANDGLKMTPEGPRAESAHDNARIRALVDSAAHPDPLNPLAGGGIIAIERPSGRRPYPFMVTSLVQNSPESTRGDAICIIFVSDPEWRQITTIDMLKTLYGLTNAEAELVQLLMQGHSLESTAEHRGVTMNTARSQLKQVFAKTETNRQGELLRLLLTGVGSVTDE
jgi:DNA-binding CsgD family transcriptional regulator